MVRTEHVTGDQIRVGDRIWSGGYEWVVDAAIRERVWRSEGFRWRFTCHWSGRGSNPHFFNDNFSTALREDLPWRRSLEV